MLIRCLQDMGYRFNESGKIADLTPGELTLLQASTVAKKRLTDEQMESNRNRDYGRPKSRAATRRKAERLKRERGID